MVHESGRSPIAVCLLSLSVLGPAAEAQPVHAADLRGGPPIAAEAFGWTGCYVGANAGWMGGTDRITTHPGPGASVGPLTGLPPADAALLTNSYRSQDSAGFAGGGQIGCNWQGASSFVFGVEADFNGARLRETTLAAYPAVTLPITAVDVPARTETVTKNLDWYSTVRARLGLSWDRWFGYVTGGLAVAHIDSSLSLSAGPFAGSDSRTRYGWTAGGGLEYAFANNWSARVEYLYLDLGTYNYQIPHTIADQRFWSADISAREHVVRAGVNYRY